MLVVTDRHLNDRRDCGLLAGVEGVIDAFLEDHERPYLDRMPGRDLQLLLRAELRQPRDRGGDALDLVPRLIFDLSARPLEPRAPRGAAAGGEP